MPLYLNDHDTQAEFKLIAEAPKGFMGPPGVQDRLVPVVGRMGALRVSGERDTEPRRFTVGGAIVASTQIERDTLWDQFTQLLSADELEIRFSTWPDRVGYGQCESMTPEWLEGPNRGQKFTLSFVLPDPLKYSRQPDIYTISSGGEATLQLGSAASDVRLHLIGNGSDNPQVLYKDAQGQTHGDLSFALTPLIADNWIDWNWGGYQLAQRHRVPTGGTVTELTDLPEMVPTLLFVADPNDGDGTQGPSLTAINCRIQAFVRKSWR